MVDHSGKNLPRPTIETEKYWQGCRKHELLIQKCTECDHYQFYPRIMCTRCSSNQVEWERTSGKGIVISFTIIRRPISKAYKAETPYVVALIKLEEGPVMMSNIIHCDLEAVKVGMGVEVEFEDWSEEISIPKFRPANEGV
ncbi:Zn-ribbon domain-containing OB-fold protein [Alkalihalobacterium elongatum]|uniref:Zn-ribbon domain-containing OB-fold protein n=1 Tax=Alkalihalobacterium elongatum TaxID=2675466 RepID=UPI001C1F9C96|nr:Zn-ribbon domain-containing OB-fold protein [Alkalihalobacterium elongatum]